jgi:malate dehydrogenase (oxaloacetate-decarboxylating)(NADP+)
VLPRRLPGAVHPRAVSVLPADRGCECAGDAGLHSAHITSSLARRLGGGGIIGPLLMGMEKPVQIMPMDASVSQIVDLACQTAGR